MLGRSTGAVLVGVEAHLVEVEVDLRSGLPAISAVGLPDSAVREGIEELSTWIEELRMPFEIVVRTTVPDACEQIPCGIEQERPRMVVGLGEIE